MPVAARDQTSRPVRVTVPVLVTLSTGSFTIRDFTLNLAEGGIFLPTNAICPVGTRGRLKFRASPFDDPFVLEAEVVRVVSEPAGATETPGLGIRFVDVSDGDRRRLRELVDGARSGSVVEGIRRSIRGTGDSIDRVLRRRPTDQKALLALQANSKEIVALIRDANPAVMMRLLECPRLTAVHVQAMLRNRSMPARVLAAVKRNDKWLANDEVRRLFCTHPTAMLEDVYKELPKLNRQQLSQLASDTRLRQPVRIRAKALFSRGRS